MSLTTSPDALELVVMHGGPVLCDTDHTWKPHGIPEFPGLCSVEAVAVVTNDHGEHGLVCETITVWWAASLVGSDAICRTCGRPALECWRMRDL